MSLKPIDYQVMLPKVNEVSRDLSGQLSKYNALQKQQSERVKDNAEKGQKEVRDRESANEARIKEREQKRDGSNNKREEMNKEEKKRRQEKNRDDSRGKARTIDIRL